MAKTKLNPPLLVQCYDYSKVVEYYKKYRGLIFSYDEIVRSELIDNKLILKIKSDKMPDEICWNGKPVRLIPNNMKKFDYRTQCQFCFRYKGHRKNCPALKIIDQTNTFIKN